ncbi:MAG: corrinoid protein [Candidatus Bathyarchaeota archaeon]|nr:MAG: corrinoid protein [Candidatus Bathyarchaeota archaeon]
MVENSILRSLARAIEELRSPETVLRLVSEAIEAGIPPFKIIKDSLSVGMEEVGRKYEANEYFVGDLIMASVLMEESMKLLDPLLKDLRVGSAGKVIIGTVRGDLHDIGKNIVAAMLSSAGFDVYDLGIDVSTETFIQKTRILEPHILGLSSLLTTTMSYMKEVIEALENEGLRDKVKVIVGGRPITSDFAEQIGADAYAEDGIKAVKKAETLMQNSIHSDR